MSELKSFLGADVTDPIYIAARKHARERRRNAKVTHCANGCTNYHDPDTDEIFMGFGPAGCEEEECNQ